MTLPFSRYMTVSEFSRALDKDYFLPGCGVGPDNADDLENGIAGWIATAEAGRHNCYLHAAVGPKKTRLCKADVIGACEDRPSCPAPEFTSCGSRPSHRTGTEVTRVACGVLVQAACSEIAEAATKWADEGGEPALDDA